MGATAAAGENWLILSDLEQRRPQQYRSISNTGNA
jgi:hypothetical protein